MQSFASHLNIRFSVSSSMLNFSSGSHPLVNTLKDSKPKLLRILRPKNPPGKLYRTQIQASARLPDGLLHPSSSKQSPSAIRKKTEKEVEDCEEAFNEKVAATDDFFKSLKLDKI